MHDILWKKWLNVIYKYMNIKNYVYFEEIKKNVMIF